MKNSTQSKPAKTALVRRDVHQYHVRVGDNAGREIEFAMRIENGRTSVGLSWTTRRAK